MTEMEKTPSKSNGVFILITILLLIGLAVLSYFFSKKNNDLNACINENTALKTDMNGMNEMMTGYVGNMSNNLTKDFQNMLNTYDDLIQKDNSKADSLNIQKEKIISLMSDLDKSRRNGSLNAQKIAQLNKENTTLRSIMKSYVFQIDSLNTLNVKLNTELNQTNSKLESTQSERDQYKKEATEKAEQVRLGAKLQAFNFKSNGLKMKINNTTDETNRARNCMQIQSSFTLSENPLNKSGNKTIYLQITDPSGKILQTKSNYTVETENGIVAYSDKKDVNYQNKQLDMSIYYDFASNEEAIKGTYKIKIFCDGSIAGTDSFILK
jgi:chromosome segregation ATPase